jgi:hypothetical protein
MLLPAMLAVVLAAGCGGGNTTYSADRSRACLVKAGYKVKGPPADDLVASAAEGGAFSVRFGTNLFGTNLVIVSFGLDRSGAERIVRGYQRFHGKNIGLTDVLSVDHNAVLLWAAHPTDANVTTIKQCLS